MAAAEDAEAAQRAEAASHQAAGVEVVMGKPGTEPAEQILAEVYDPEVKQGARPETSVRFAGAPGPGDGDRPADDYEVAFQIAAATIDAMTFAALAGWQDTGDQTLRDIYLLGSEWMRLNASRVPALLLARNGGGQS